MAETTTQRHWLFDFCQREPEVWQKHLWLVSPWLVPWQGRTWTLASNAKVMLLLLGEHGGAEPATAQVMRACAEYLKPPPSGEVYVYDEFVSWLGPCQPRETCPECKGDGKWHIDPDDVAWSVEDGVEPVHGEHCDLCGGDGLEPSPPVRVVEVCGAVVNGNLLAAALAGCARAWPDNDLVMVCPHRGEGLAFPEPQNGPLWVRTPHPLWAVLTMPVQADPLTDPVTAAWPPAPRLTAPRGVVGRGGDAGRRGRG